MDNAATIADALAAGRQQLPPLEARQLLEVVVNRPTAWLVTHDHELLSPAQLDLYHAFLARAAAGEPIPYITGRIWFYGRPFTVTPDVLIPRPETEELVGHALASFNSLDKRFSEKRPEPLHVVDVGTGSGCIAVTLGCELSNQSVAITAIDQSNAALAVARKNWRQLTPTNPEAQLSFIKNDLLLNFSKPIDLLVANLPYVTDQEYTELPPSVREYEPQMALRGGDDGLRLIDTMLRQARPLMNRPGGLLLEIGWRQGEKAVSLCRSIFPDAAIACLKDLAAHDRIIEVKLQ